MPAARKPDTLISLQDLDLQIHGLKVHRAGKPRQLASFEEKVSRARENVEGIHSEIKVLKLEGAKMELNVKEFDDKASKLQAQSMQVKKNDEYQAFQKEISGVKADKSRVEDGLLDILMQIDEKGKLEKIRQEELQQAEGEYGTAKKRIEGEMAVLDGEIDALLARRSSHTGGVDKEMLRMYERVLEAKDDGLALSAVGKYEVIEDEGKMTYWQCEGCSVGINLQDLNLLMQGRDVQCCRNCSRILYIKPA